MKEIVKIHDIVVTPEDIVARLVKFDDGTGAVQTFFRPDKQWVDGGLEVDSFVMAPSAAEETLEEIGYTDEEIDLVFEGFEDPDLD